MSEDNMTVLNFQQEEAKKLIVEWFNTKLYEKQIFVLAGYAGTGKTFLINYIINNELNLNLRDIAFVAPTGKAASVMIQRGILSAMTIHKLIYHVVETEVTTKVGDSSIKTKKLSFVKKSGTLPYKLIIVDEVSMVDKKTFIDLMSFGIPILCCGDAGQLPPISESNNLLKKPDFMLTEIVRQSENNPIIKIATLARKGIPIKKGNYNNKVFVINKSDITEEQFENLLTKADQVLCGKNSTRIILNNLIKTKLGLDPNKLNPGEKIISFVNNWEKFLDEDKSFNLVNGTMGYVKDCEIIDGKLGIGKLSFQAEFLDEITDDIYYDSNFFKNNEFSYDMHQKVLLFKDGKLKLKKFIEKREENESASDFKKRMIHSILENRNSIDEEIINQISPGYCISVHKSQGSEWNNGVIIYEGDCFEDPDKWLYTAITRFKNKLVLIY